MGKMILLAIHPGHASNIICGDKIFEYRRVLPKQEISYLALYATSPIKKIVAVAEVTNCITGSPTKVWRTTSFGSGISQRFFRNYFCGRKSANAFYIGRVYEMTNPLSLSQLSETSIPPQSYCYLDRPSTQKILNNKKRRISQRPRKIFLGGVHGAGKGTVCRSIFSPAGYHCVTASTLIREQGRIPDYSKRVTNVPDNQSVLVRALDSKSKNHRRLLLDGHFTLINGEDTIEPIGIEVFHSMNIDQLFLVKGKVEDIVSRLKARDSEKWEPSFIEYFQREEESHARYVAKDIGVPLRIIRG